MIRKKEFILKNKPTRLFYKKEKFFVAVICGISFFASWCLCFLFFTNFHNENHSKSNQDNVKLEKSYFESDYNLRMIRQGILDKYSSSIDPTNQSVKFFSVQEFNSGEISGSFQSYNVSYLNLDGNVAFYNFLPDSSVKDEVERFYNFFSKLDSDWEKLYSDTIAEYKAATPEQKVEMFKDKRVKKILVNYPGFKDSRGRYNRVWDSYVPVYRTQPNLAVVYNSQSESSENLVSLLDSVVENSKNYDFDFDLVDVSNANLFDVSDYRYQGGTEVTISPANTPYYQQYKVTNGDFGRKMDYNPTPKTIGDALDYYYKNVKDFH